MLLCVLALVGCARERVELGVPATAVYVPSAGGAAAGEAWLVGSAGVVREAVLSRPGRTLATRVEVAAGEELRLYVTALTRPMPAGDAPAAGQVGAALGTMPEVELALEVEDASGPGLLEAVSLRLDDETPWRRVDLPPADVATTLELDLLARVAPAEGRTVDVEWVAWSLERRASRLAPGDDARPNLLLVSIDTLRADRLSLYGYERPTTPRLDAWATRRAVVFEQTVASAPWTLPAHWTMLSGLDALHHGVNHDVGGIDRSGSPAAAGALELLAERLRAAGYATGAATGGAYLHPKYGLARGFDEYRYWRDRARDHDELRRGVDAAMAWIGDARSRPFFYFLHTYAVHDPYRPWAGGGGVGTEGLGVEVPPEAAGTRVAIVSAKNTADDAFRQRNRFVLRRGGDQRPATADDAALISALYDRGVGHADREIGRLLTWLEDQGLAENTVVVITSDHGEALDPIGRVGHADLTDDVLLVPLVVALPEARGAGARIARQVRQVDLTPTVLDALGLEVPAALDGISLLPLLASTDGVSPNDPDGETLDNAWSYAGSSNRGLALRRGGLKYIHDDSPWPPARGGEQLYDLERDPGERSSLLGDGAQAADELADGLGERLQAMRSDVFAQAASATGLFLHIGNEPAGGRLVAQIEGPMVRPLGVKALDMPCDCLEWLEMGVARLEVPAGVGFTLRFEKVFGNELRLRGAFDDEDDGSRRFDTTVRVVDLESELLRWRLDEPSWRGVEVGADGSLLDAAARGFTLWWRGAETVRSASPGDGDSELARQLRALGYVQ
ncbi:MAG: sulfatase [Acidobacteriota bacterium]